MIFKNHLLHWGELNKWGICSSPCVFNELYMLGPSSQVNKLLKSTCEHAGGEAFTWLTHSRAMKTPSVGRWQQHWVYMWEPDVENISKNHELSTKSVSEQLLCGIQHFTHVSAVLNETSEWLTDRGMSRCQGRAEVAAVPSAAAEVEPFCFLSLPSTKGNRAELCPCRHRAGPGCRKLITGLHQNLNRQVSGRLALPASTGYTDDGSGREGELEREGESPRLRQMPYSSHRGYFVTSKWPFGLYRPRMLMCHRSW